MVSCNSSFIRNQLFNNVAPNSYCMTFHFGSVFMSETMYVGNFTTGGINITDVSTVFITDSSFEQNRLLSVLQQSSSINVVGNVNLTVLRTNFSDNQANIGGAIAGNGPSRILISDCYFCNNTAVYGGAIYFDSESECIIRRSYFFNNTATSGGAIYMYSNPFKFRHNTAKYNGGAVNIPRGQVKIFHSQFLDNFVDEYGGAIAIKGNITTTQYEYIGNTANERGGAIDILNGNLNTSNSLFAYNKGRQFGGAIFSNRSSVAILNTNFYFNQASLGGAIHHFASKMKHLVAAAPDQAYTVIVINRVFCSSLSNDTKSELSTPSPQQGSSTCAEGTP